MGLVTEEKMAEILLGEDGLDKDALKEYIETRRAAKLDDRSASTQRMERDDDEEEDDDEAAVHDETGSSPREEVRKMGDGSNPEQGQKLREHDSSSGSTTKPRGAEHHDILHAPKSSESPTGDAEHESGVAGLSILEKVQKKRETEEDKRLQNLRSDMEQRILDVEASLARRTLWAKNIHKKSLKELEDDVQRKYEDDLISSRASVERERSKFIAHLEKKKEEKMSADVKEEEEESLKEYFEERRRRIEQMMEREEKNQREMVSCLRAMRLKERASLQDRITTASISSEQNIAAWHRENIRTMYEGWMKSSVTSSQMQEDEVHLQAELLKIQLNGRQTFLQEKLKLEKESTSNESREEEALRSKAIRTRFQSLLDDEISRLHEATSQRLEVAQSDSEKEKVRAASKSRKEALEKQYHEEERRRLTQIKKEINDNEKQIVSDHERRMNFDRQSAIQVMEQDSKTLLGDDPAAPSAGMEMDSIGMEWDAAKISFDAKMQRIEDEANHTKAKQIEETDGKLDEELAQGTMTITQEINQKQEQEEQNLNALFEEALSSVHTETERRRIIEDHDRALAQLEDNFSAEREKQVQELSSKIKERRERMLREIDIKARENLLDSMNGVLSELQKKSLSQDVQEKRRTILGEDHVENAQLFVPMVQDSGLTPEEERTRNYHQELLDGLKKRHADEMKKEMKELEGKLRTEFKEKMRNAEEKISSQFAQKKQQLAAEVDADVASASDEAEAQQILEEHKKQLENLTHSMELEKTRQERHTKKLLERRIAERRREIQRVQEGQEESLMERTQRDEKKLHAEIQRASERHALEEAISAGHIHVSRIEEAVERVLQQRHASELKDLGLEQAKERDKLESETEESVRNRLKIKFEDLVADFKDRRSELIADGKSDMLGDLDREYESQKARIESEIEEEIMRTKNEVLTAADVRHAQHRIELRKQQLSEVASMCEELSPEQASLRINALKHAKKQEELRQISALMAAEKERAEKEAKELMAKSEREQKVRYEEEMKRLQVELKREREKVENQISSIRQKKAEELRRIREEADKQLHEELAHSTEETRDEIIARHRMDSKDYEESLLSERERQEKAIREKLVERQRKKVKKKRQQLKDDMEKARLQEMSRQNEEKELLAERQKQEEVEMSKFEMDLDVKRQEEEHVVESQIRMVEEKLKMPAGFVVSQTGSEEKKEFESEGRTSETGRS
eukprot:TRINITY_DN455_c1_g1_i1.p1 TRINITY_DN455_c1_g1~~TRINITY_DN455_c1_g1_i1.p1  ORF type:complete len:1213 (+),score=497.26 TRINITY_DN455_c1_g1_i1:351-3989(+)